MNISTNRENIIDHNLSNALGYSGIETFAHEVILKLYNENITPTPYNYAFYFEQMLEEKCVNFRHEILSMLEFEEDRSNENDIELEKRLKKGFSTIRGVLQLSTSLYNNMQQLQKILNGCAISLELKVTSSDLNTIVALLKNDVTKFTNVLEQQIPLLKTTYVDTSLIIEQVKVESVFDSKLGVYNKRYLLEKLAKECRSIKKLGHKSSVVAVSLSHETLNTKEDENMRRVMDRILAQLLQKTSRRSDTVAHCKDGIFMLILKHTDLKHAKDTAERLCTMVKNSHFYISEQEMKLPVSIGITEINVSISIEQTLIHALDAMKKSAIAPELRYVIHHN